MIQTLFERAPLLRCVAATVYSIARRDHFTLADGVADGSKLFDGPFREGLFIDWIRAEGFSENDHWYRIAPPLSVDTTHSLDQSIYWGRLEIAIIEIYIQTHLDDLCSH